MSDRERLVAKDVEIERLRAELAEAREERDQAREELAGLKARAIVLPVDWRNQVALAVMRNQRYYRMASIAVEALIDSWSAPAVDGGGETARVLVDQYAAEDPADGDYGNVTRGHLTPEAFDALRAVVGLDAEVDRRIVAALAKAAPARPSRCPWCPDDVESTTCACPAPTEEPGETRNPYFNLGDVVRSKHTGNVLTVVEPLENWLPFYYELVRPAPSPQENSEASDGE